jgi:4-hydroxy 2-oxovalerate aldolase
MKILDCTLRDGGYYTNWDFDSELVKTYLESFNHLPVDYLEIGYRSNPMKGYLGEYFYCPTYVLEEVKNSSNKKLVIILNEKDVKVNDLQNLLGPCIGLIEMVRIAIDPKNLKRALILAEGVKKLGFEVGFNVMYMSTWSSQKEFLNELPLIDGVTDYFYMVDSFGGVFPEDVKATYDLVKSKVDVKIGFHGHNNMELALINTLTAIECGADIIDSTVTGMGRGAGNLKTELLLTTLNAKGKIDLDFNPLSKVVDGFSKLQAQYEWGTNLPYMVSGANSLPQKDVMDWVGKRYYSFNSIIRALDNQSKGVEDNQKLTKYNFSEAPSAKEVLIVGGGPSVVKNAAAINHFISNNPEIVIIHASSKNSFCLNQTKQNHFYCLVGNEGHRLEDVFNGDYVEGGKCILPPFPRKMGTYIPNSFIDNSFELEEISFTNLYKDSHTTLALQTAINLGAKKAYFVGYDGYIGNSISEKEQELYLENEFLFDSAIKQGMKCVSLTPTTYKKIEQESIFALI